MVYTYIRVKETTNMKGENNMKELFKNYEAADKEMNEIETRYENDPENEELSEAYDKAYNKYFTAWKALVNEIVNFTNGMIDSATAKAMIATKRTELKTLIERLA